MFMMSVDGQTWSGQFTGTPDDWREALKLLKTIRGNQINAEDAGSASDDQKNGRSDIPAPEHTTGLPRNVRHRVPNLRESDAAKTPELRFWDWQDESQQWRPGIQIGQSPSRGNWTGRPVSRDWSAANTTSWVLIASSRLQ